MTDLMLDRLLEASREAEPMDDGFVRSVMDEVHADEQRRWRMKLVRRPVVFGVAVTVLATSGAVAALVGTHAPSHPTALQTPGTAQVTVSAGPHSSRAPLALPSASSVAPSSSSQGSAPKTGLGLLSHHTAFAIDPATGLKLTTETYTNDFHTGKAQQVTLTVLNTGPNAIVVSGLNSCGLQVLATPAAGNGLSPVCASGGVSQANVVLAPGGFYTANAALSLPSAGPWNVVGQCTCTYSHPTQTDVTSTTSTGSLGGSLAKQAPPVLILPKASPPGNGIAKLATPAIAVDASR